MTTPRFLGMANQMVPLAVMPHGCHIGFQDGHHCRCPIHLKPNCILTYQGLWSLHLRITLPWDCKVGVIESPRLGKMYKPTHAPASKFAVLEDFACSSISKVWWQVKNCHLVAVILNFKMAATANTYSSLILQHMGTKFMWLFLLGKGNKNAYSLKVRTEAI